MPPSISVIMPVYRCDRFLVPAITSVLIQTLEDFELIIISEHGNEEAMARILASLNDDRIFCIQNEINLGLSPSMNVGIINARGRYIVKLGADDVAVPTRLEKQAGYLDKNLSIGILGSAIRMIDLEGKELGTQRPISGPMALRWICTFGTPFPDPTAMIRRSVFDNVGGFDPRALHCEDFDLYARANQVTLMDTLPDLLTEYRINPGGVSISNRDEQERCAVKIVKREISRLLDRDVPETVPIDLRIPDFASTPTRSEQASKCLMELYTGFCRSNEISEVEKREICTFTSDKMWHLTVSSLANGPRGSTRLFRRALAIPAYHPISFPITLAKSYAVQISKRAGGLK